MQVRFSNYQSKIVSRGGLYVFTFLNSDILDVLVKVNGGRDRRANFVIFERVL